MLTYVSKAYKVVLTVHIYVSNTSKKMRFNLGVLHFQCKLSQCLLNILPSTAIYNLTSKFFFPLIKEKAFSLTYFAYGLYM